MEFGNIYIRTSDSYRPFAGRKLLSFGTSEIANWQIHTGSWLDKGRVLLTDRRMVEIHIPNAIDLDALLPSPAQTPAHLKIYFASGLAGLGLALALGLFILVALAGHYPNLTRRVVIFATGGPCWLQVLLSAFPAHWTFDQYYTLNELFAGKLSDLHPPLSVLSWVFTMDLARFLGFGKLGEIAFLFVLQTTLFWIAAIYVATQFRHTAIAAAMLFAIAATPSNLSLLGDIGKDGQLMIALFLSVAVLHRADKKASLMYLALALPLLFYAYLVRTNAPAAVLPLCFYAGFVLVRILRNHISNSPTLTRNLYATTVTGVAAIALFAAFFGAALAFYKIAVPNPCCLGAPGAATALHDLMGLTARTQKNLMPDYVLTERASGKDGVTKRYWGTPGNVDFTGLNSILPADKQADLIRVWLREIANHPVEYWEHRLWVNKYFFGFTRERNMLPYFVSMSTPEFSWVTPQSRELFSGLGDTSIQMTMAKTYIIAYLVLLKDSGLMRLWVYTVVFLCALAFLPAQFDNPLNRLSLACAASASIHVLPLILLTSSASARYLSWAFLAVLATLFLRLDMSFSNRHSGAGPMRTQSSIVALVRRFRTFPIGDRVHPIANFALWTAGLLVLGYWVSSFVPVG